MYFRFRIGPFTFGRGGTRLSIWGRGGGISIPLTGKKSRTFGKISFGPFSWFFGGSKTSKYYKQNKKVLLEKNHYNFDTYKSDAIAAIRADIEFIEKLRYNGIPWRGFQERIKEELPQYISEREDVAYRLVPKAMNVIFGKQDIAWKTEKRLSKSGQNYTTWIIII